MTNKFLIYDLNNGGFYGASTDVSGNDRIDTRDNDVQNAAVFSEASAKRLGLDLSDTASCLQVPLTESFVDSLPFDLTDTDPFTPHSDVQDSADVMAAKAGDFVALTDMGFYDEKYNSLDNTSRPKVRSFELDYANLYHMDKLAKTGNEYLADDANILIPVSEVQQEKLKLLPEFSPEKEPHGFFMEPIGETMKQEQTPQMLDLGDALDALKDQEQGVELPWEM